MLGSSGTSVEFDLPAAYIGQTLYLKFSSFNLFGQMAQDLSVCTEYQYTSTGAGFGTGSAGRPAAPSGLSATLNGGQVVTTWSANAAADNVAEYVLYRADDASDFSSASVIWQGLALRYVDTTASVDAEYTYFLEAMNAVGASSPTTGSVFGATLPGAVTNLTVSVNSDGTLIAGDWDDTPYATRYLVEVIVS